MAVGKRRTGSQLGHLGLAVAGIWALRVVPAAKLVADRTAVCWRARDSRK
jgi:hypothetical protein